MLSTRPISLHSDADVAAQPILNAKTPGRKALKNRAALQENAIHSGAKTVFSKKNILQTPFRPGTAHGKKPLVSVSVTRPLMDKTPFPNRVAPSGGLGASKTPATKGFKLSKLSLLVPEPEQPESLSPDAAPLLRPSSTRKSLRGRLSGTFKTPVTKGDHWNVSPGDMGMEIAGGTTEQAAEQAAAVNDEDDEIEYMPPTAIERPYEPPFELPDYKSMGQSLFNLGHAPLLNDAPDLYYGSNIDDQLNLHDIITASGPNPGSSQTDNLELSDLEDDSPFPRKFPKSGAPVTSKAVGASFRVATSRPAAPSATRIPAPPRPATAIPQSRSSSRTTGSSSSTPAPGPAPTRTSVLRAAKAAAASSSATTPHPTRPAANATARPGVGVASRRPATGATVSKPPIRSATISGPSKAPVAMATATATSRARLAANGPAAGRARSATVSAPSSKAKPGASVKTVVDDDVLAKTLEAEVGGADEDFLFAV
ncbi:hypothetical protein C8Q77DRAFT_1219718 [Trametes polyzona]|nr:hypothetical protein C8Q77DRAFT_1219718 [Trametes polyzona]